MKKQRKWMIWNEALDEITENDRSSMYICAIMCYKWGKHLIRHIHLNQLGRFLLPRPSTVSLSACTVQPASLTMMRRLSRYGFVVQVERIPMWRISLFTPPEGEAFWHCKKKRVVFCQAFISVSFANMWVDQYITFIWTIIMKPFDLLQPGHYGLRLSSVAAAFPALLHSI